MQSCDCAMALRYFTASARPARSRLSRMGERDVETCRFLFEGDRIDGGYSVCVILCNEIELMQK
ncbi:hypothetical protein DF058_02490 [Burkholderia cenocepacia]|nr:hypothetical protein DF058_02490 [Burkholderia cenocepacia]